jgi:hypothetical protein
VLLLPCCAHAKVMAANHMFVVRYIRAFLFGLCAVHRAWYSYRKKNKII